MEPSHGKRVKLHIEQRDEWLRSLQNILTSQVENVLREFYTAAVICHQKRSGLKANDAYNRLLVQSSQWTEEKVLSEIGEKRATDAEICLHQAIKEHATILSLLAGTSCKTPLDVPTIANFFRVVLAASAHDLSENGISVFGTHDIALRKRVREWIGGIIMHEALEIVPVNKFAGRNAAVQPPPPPPAPVVSVAESVPLVVAAAPAPVPVVEGPAPAKEQAEEIAVLAPPPRPVSDSESDESDDEDEDNDSEEDQ